MKQLLTILVCVICAIAWQHHSRQETKFISSANAAEVEIYTGSYCATCKYAKSYFNSKGIDYLEHDVEYDLKSRQEFYARGGVGVPLIFVHGHKMDGFEVARFERLRAQN